MEIKQTLVLDSSDPLSKALPQLDESPAVIITKGGKYCGIIDHRYVSHGIRDPHNVKCENVITKPPVLLESSGLMDRIEAFMLGHYKALPVLDDAKRPIGITTRIELLKEMMEGNLIPHMQASELMSSPAFTIDEGETVGWAKGIMKERKAHRLVVTRRGMLVGVVSTYDISPLSMKSNFGGGQKDIHQSDVVNVDEMKISSFLRPDVTLVKEGSSLDDTVKRMVEKKVSTVLIVSQKKPVGVISALDIFKKIQEIAKETTPVTVSGLAQEDAAYFGRIQDKFGHVLERFGKSFNARNVSVHVKEGKSTYVVNVYLDTDDGHVSLKTERASLQEGIDELAVELNEILGKKKDMRRQKPRVTRAR